MSINTAISYRFERVVSSTEAPPPPPLYLFPLLNFYQLDMEIKKQILNTTAIHLRKENVLQQLSWLFNTSMY